MSLLLLSTFRPSQADSSVVFGSCDDIRGMMVEEQTLLLRVLYGILYDTSAFVNFGHISQSPFSTTRKRFTVKQVTCFERSA